MMNGRKIRGTAGDTKLMERLKEALWNHPDIQLRNDARFMISKLDVGWDKHQKLSVENRELQKNNSYYRIEIDHKNQMLDELSAIREENDQLRDELNELKLEMHGLLMRENRSLMEFLAVMADRERQMRRPTLLSWLRVILGY